jgi:hypothetical protein
MVLLYGMAGTATRSFLQQGASTRVMNIALSRPLVRGTALLPGSPSRIAEPVSLDKSDPSQTKDESIDLHAARSLLPEPACADSSVLTEGLTANWIAFQLASLLRSLHRRRLCLGPVTPDFVTVDRHMWVRLLQTPECCSILENLVGTDNQATLRGLVSRMRLAHGSASQRTSIPRIPRLLAGEAWRANTEKWVVGLLSNFDYLMLLNQFAGRRVGEADFASIMPWVTDFSVHPLLMLLDAPLSQLAASRASLSSACPDQPTSHDDFPHEHASQSDSAHTVTAASVVGDRPSGWRDLTRSKYALKKGADQLRLNFITAAHHVTGAHH